MHITHQQFWDFNIPFENAGGGPLVTWMYSIWDQENKSDPTVGVLEVATGNGLTFTGTERPADGGREWVYKPGHPKAGQACDPRDITADYNKVLSMGDLAKAKVMGGDSRWQEATNCRITENSLKDAVGRKLDSSIRTLRNLYFRYFFDFDNYPADAQLALASLAFGVGPHFPLSWPKLCEACRDQRWIGVEKAPDTWVASEQCRFGHPILTQKQRSDAQVQLFKNAGVVKADGLSPKPLYSPVKLYYPQILPLPAALELADPNSPDGLIGEWDVTFGKREPNRQVLSPALSAGF